MMKCFLLVLTGLLTVAMLVGGVGCNKGTPSGKKFTLKTPPDMTIKQGEQGGVSVEITREDKFSDPVDLKITDLPDGVNVHEKDMTFLKGANSWAMAFGLKAADDAKVVEDHKVTLTASGGGTTQTATFKLTVKKKT